MKQLKKSLKGLENCFISEITLAELKFGVENSQAKEKNAAALANFLIGIIIIPVFPSLDIYAREKTRLRKAGQPVDDFDLLIGATAISNDLTLITNNVDHSSHYLCAASFMAFDNASRPSSNCSFVGQPKPRRI